MKQLFTPAVALMNRLSYPRKFVLISLLLAAPLALVIALLVRELDTRVGFAQQELAGIAYLRPLRNLFEHALLEQKLANEYAIGEIDMKGALLSNQARLDQDLQALEAADRQFGAALGAAGQLTEIQSLWDDIKARGLNMRAQQSDQRHEQLIAKLRALISQVGDSSNLILDPQLDSYYIMDAILLKLPEGQSLLTQVWMAGDRIIDRQTDYPDDRAHAIIRGGLLASNIDAIRHGLTVAFRVNPAARAALEAPLEAYDQATSGFLNQTEREIIHASAINLQPDVYAASAAHMLAANSVLWDRSADMLAGLLHARIDRFNSQKYLALGVSALVLVVVIYLWIGFYLAVMRTVATLDVAAQRMIGGDMRQMVQLDNRDELGKVARSFNDIATALVAASAERQAVVDNAVDGILTIDESGIVQSFNPAAARIFGRPAGDVLGQPVARLIPAPHDCEYRVVGVGREVVGRRGDGASFPLDLAIGEMHTGDRRAFIAIAHDLTERKRVEADRTRLQEEVIRVQAATLAELSTPLIPISDTVLVMPLIGAIDTQRAQQVLDTLLNGIERSQARIAILDITGVPMVDTQVAATLITAAQGVRLLGAQTVLTGIRPEVAQTLVGLGIDLSSVVTRSTLQSGIAYATSAHQAAGNAIDRGVKEAQR